MGVSDLLAWIKKTHPNALLTFPQRWAAPEIRGKRIAIDATLLTNRFHFAITDGPLRGKGALVGWYNLISIMRAHDIQPVAIWDKPGVREWKAVETRRRLATRVLASARRQHEDERQDRLSDLRDGLVALQGLSTEEQEAVRSAWSIAVDPTPIPPASVHVPPSAPSSFNPHAPLPADEPHAEEAIERITTMQDTLRDLVGRYQASVSAPTSRNRDPDVIDDVVEHLTELEELSQSLETNTDVAKRDHAEWVRAREEAREFVDEKAGELLPTERFTETKRQSSLTLEEGRIIEDFLRPKSGEVVAEQAEPASIASVKFDDLPLPQSTSAPDAKEEIIDIPSIPLEPLERLDALIESAPPVRDIYERALFQPSADTHADCQDLLGRLGIPILLAEAPYEAEGLATSLALAGVVDWVGSEDSDVIALGVSHTGDVADIRGPLLKNISTAGLPLVALPSDPLLSLTTLTRSQFTDFCILLGNDACPRIRGVGPVAAYKYILQHKSIEAILENKEKARIKIPDMEEYMDMVRTAREVFAALPPISDEVKRELEGTFEGMKDKRVDLEVVERWLEERHGIRFVAPGEALE